MLILDTNVLVAALRSRTGQSRVLLKQILERKRIAGVSVPLFLEYEAVLLRPENLKSFGLTSHQVTEFLDGLAGCLKPIDVTYLWRPQLRDTADEMVLEAAVNLREAAAEDGVAMNQYVAIALAEKLASRQTAKQFLELRASKGNVQRALDILEISGSDINEVT